MKILILFSGIGGATKGIKNIFPRAEITTVDIDPDVNPDLCKDALSFSLCFYKTFNFCWASPPCQKYSISTNRAKLMGKTYPDLLDRTRKILRKAGIPFVIENVIGCNMIKNRTVILRGYNFKELRDIRRPRKFECWGFKPDLPPVYDKIFPSKRLISGGGGWIRSGENVVRMTLEEAKQRFGIEGTMQELAQIVIPQYAEYIMKAFKNTLKKKNLDLYIPKFNKDQNRK